MAETVEQLLKQQKNTRREKLIRDDIQRNYYEADMLRADTQGHQWRHLKVNLRFLHVDVRDEKIQKAMAEIPMSSEEKKKRRAWKKQKIRTWAAYKAYDEQVAGEESLKFRRLHQGLARGVHDLSAPLREGELAVEVKTLQKRLAYLDEVEKSSLAAVEVLAAQQKAGRVPISEDPKESIEAKRLFARLDAQRRRVYSFQLVASQMPLGSEERALLLEKREAAELVAARLEQEYKAACMKNSQERERANATIRRHARYDQLKKIFRSPTPYSKEDAVLELRIGDNAQEKLNLINCGRATLGGTKAMYVFQEANEMGTEWLFKEATNCVGIYKPEGAIVTEAASKLQQRLRGPLSIPAYCVRDEKTGKVCGAVQKKIKKAADGQDLFAWQAKMQDGAKEDTLPDATKADLLNEHTLDWLLCNFDTKGENFLNQEGGHIISFDKEASFNTLLQEGARHMSKTFKPHANDTVYNTLFQAYANGTINLDLSANLEAVKTMEAMDTDEFIALFKETLDTKYGTKGKDRRRAEELLRQRKESLRQEYCDFYTKLIEERLKHFEAVEAEGKTEEEKRAAADEQTRLKALLTNGKYQFPEKDQ